MISIDVLTSDWTALSPAEQLAQWESFIAELDAGAAGFHPYYRVMMPLWERGDAPDLVSAAQLFRYEDEMRADATWDLHHPWPSDTWTDYRIRQLDPATADFDLAELTF